jgi:hypothetical protein
VQAVDFAGFFRGGGAKYTLVKVRGFTNQNSKIASKNSQAKPLKSLTIAKIVKRGGVKRLSFSGASTTTRKKSHMKKGILFCFSYYSY